MKKFLVQEIDKLHLLVCVRMYDLSPSIVRGILNVVRVSCLVLIDRVEG